MNETAPQTNQKAELDTKPGTKLENTASPAQPGSEADSVLVFSVGPVELCVYMQSIQSVQDMQTLSSIPTSAPYILGGFWQHEKYVPVVNTRYKFALPEPEDATSNSLITTYVGEELFAFRVDKIIGVTAANQYQWQKLPRLGTGIFKHALTSLTEKNDRIKLEVDLENLKDAPYLNVNSLLPFLSKATNTSNQSSIDNKKVLSNTASTTKNKTTANKNEQPTTVSNTNSTTPKIQTGNHNSDTKENIQANHIPEKNNKTTTNISATADNVPTETPPKPSTTTKDATTETSNITKQHSTTATNYSSQTTADATITKKRLEKSAPTNNNSAPSATATQPETHTQAITPIKTHDPISNIKTNHPGNNFSSNKHEPTQDKIVTQTATAEMTNVNEDNITPDNTNSAPLLFLIATIICGIAAYYLWPSSNLTTIKSSTVKTLALTKTKEKLSTPEKTIKPTALTPTNETTTEPANTTSSNTDDTLTVTQAADIETLESDITKPARLLTESTEPTESTTETIMPERIVIDLADHEIIIERHSTINTKNPASAPKIMSENTKKENTQTATQSTTPTTIKAESPQTSALTPGAPASSEKLATYQQNYNLPENILFQHVVVKGDTLWHIAKTYLGDPYKYPQLANLSGINNPDLIYPGDVVKMRKKQPVTDW